MASLRRCDAVCTSPNWREETPLLFSDSAKQRRSRIWRQISRACSRDSRAAAASPNREARLPSFKYVRAMDEASSIRFQISNDVAISSSLRDCLDMVAQYSASCQATAAE